MRVCIVTAAQLCNNPRVLKEADALHAAGHEVRVVAQDSGGELRRFDSALMRDRRWRLDCVPVGRAGDLRHRVRWAAAGVMQKAARAAFDRGVRAAAVRDRALGKWHDAFYAAAIREAADLVIGHYLKALPAAAAAARRLGARLAFDVEDLHSGELPEGAGHESERALVSAVEAALLPECAYVTCSSEPIARELSGRYRMVAPAVVLNAFAGGDVVADVPDERAGALSLYWVSQVIGPNRGLEDALRALALLPPAVHLSLRGGLPDGYRAELERAIDALGIGGRVHVLPFAAPDELIARAAQHDVGLALEPGFSLNNRLASSNKLFTYLAAGLAVAATDTPGQRAVLEQVDGAALYRAGDAASLARAIREWHDHPEALRRARSAAAQAAREAYAWEAQAEHLVRYLTGNAAAEHARGELQPTAVT